MSERINTILGWIIKAAGMIICAPVTFLVAGQLFGDVTALTLRFVVQLSAVLLVEGVLLSNWLLLEFDRRAAPEIKTRYALTALSMYLGIWVLAWQHGEGPAGLVFRAALGAALVGAGWDTYVLTWQRLTARTDRDVTTSGSVKRFRRKLAILDAKEAIRAEFLLSRERRVVDVLVEGESLEAQKAQRLTAVKLDHKREMQKLSEPVERPALPSGFPYPVRKAQKNRARQQQETREDKLRRLVDILRADPEASLRQLGAVLDVSHETANRYLNQLESEGIIRRDRERGLNEVLMTPVNGNGHHQP